jgi:ADP-ribose pyrophosphatase YjhB (NUDIX family)
MNRIEKERLDTPTIQSTSVILIDGDKVLLGMKKRGFATGKWNGFGGKQKNNETTEEAARREVKEEADILVNELNECAILECHHPDAAHEVHVYTATKWEGNPQESDEMKPQWFSKGEVPVPYHEMWADAAILLPMILEGEKVRAILYFDEEGTLLNAENPDITVVENFE